MIMKCEAKESISGGIVTAAVMIMSMLIMVRMSMTIMILMTTVMTIMSTGLGYI